MKKILACTSIRSDYDLMSPLYRLFEQDEAIDFKILVSGAHLSPQHGYSVNQIKQDGFQTLLEVETLIGSDSPISRVKSASLLLQNSLETIQRFNPDLMVFAGDREDVLIYAMIGGYLGIPTAHFFAGDHVTDGYIDNPIRHAASKLSSIHFVALPEHKRRLVRMGELAKRVHVTGNIALDRFVNFTPISLLEIQEKLNLDENLEKFALLIFHPVTKEKDRVDEYFENILSNLDARKIKTFVSYPNIDPGNQKLISVIERYTKNTNFIFYKNLERDLFLSIYKHASFIIGNSSSGICEAASVRIPAINVGLRQTGRYADENVVFCGTEYQQISDALDKIHTDTFKKAMLNLKNSYGDGKSAPKAYKIIKDCDFKSLVSKEEDPLQVELL